MDLRDYSNCHDIGLSRYYWPKPGQTGLICAGNWKSPGLTDHLWDLLMGKKPGVTQRAKPEALLLCSESLALYSSDEVNQDVPAPSRSRSLTFRAPSSFSSKTSPCTLHRAKVSPQLLPGPRRTEPEQRNQQQKGKSPGSGSAISSDHTVL